MVRLLVITQTKIGVIVGLSWGMLSGVIYQVVLHAPRSAFYFFALLAFVIGPIIGGFVAAKKPAEHRSKVFIFSSAISFVLLSGIFILTFAFVPVFLVTSFNLPSSCNGTYKSADISREISYIFPDGTRGVLINQNASSLVATKIDYNLPSHPTHTYLIRRSDNKVLWHIDFADDTVAVAFDNDTAYVFNNALGYFLDTQTGERKDVALSMDNYGYNDHDKFQTTGIFTTWHRDGSVKSLSRLYFNGVERGCYITGNTSRARGL
jgi:hypothetical protein